MQRIHRYETYRAFLKDFYLERKKRQSFSYARFSTLAGLKSPNYLKLVIDGKRDLTTTNIQSFADAMELQHAERSVFEALVLRDQSRSPAERRYYSRRLSELKAGTTPTHRLVRRGDVIAKWYYPAILFSMHHQRVTVSHDRIAKLLGITLQELRDGLKELTERGLIRIEGDRFEATYRHFLIDDPKSMLIQKGRYIASQLDRSMRAFGKHYPKTGHFHAYTFTIGKDELAKLDSRLSSFVEQLCAEAERLPMDKVAQLNIQFFPLGE